MPPDGRADADAGGHRNVAAIRPEEEEAGLFRQCPHEGRTEILAVPVRVHHFLDGALVLIRHDHGTLLAFLLRTHLDSRLEEAAVELAVDEAVAAEPGV